jgi:hypothetical protein
MDQNQHSKSAGMLDGDRDFLINQSQLMGLATVFIGLSQLPMAIILANVTGHDSSLFVVGAGGWLLIGIGVNLFRGMEAFESKWGKNERLEWLSVTVTVVLALAVVAVSGFMTITTLL